MWGVDANNTINELISTFLQRYKERLETKMRGSNFIFNHVTSLEYHFNKVSLKRGSSYRRQPEWLSYKKSTINPYNHSDNQCFLYAIVIALNYHNIDNNPQGISNLIPFIPNYNWYNIDFPVGHKGYSQFEKNNTDIALNVLYIRHDMQKIRQCYISKHNKTRNTHANLLMITEGHGKWHYVAIKSISGLLRGITSTHNGGFYSLNCFHLYRTQEKLKEQRKKLVEYTKTYDRM